MGTTAETGRMGERAAAEFLRRAGYEICALNWRSGRYELDIVARKGDFVHFVEVKTRCADGLTPPEAAVTPQKFRALTRAALRYMACTGEEREAQFDLIAVEVMPGGETEVRLIPQAMEYNWQFCISDKLYYLCRTEKPMFRTKARNEAGLSGNR